MAQVSDLLHEGIERLRASGSESARLDTELLLAHVLGVGRTTVLAHPEAPVGPAQAADFEAAIGRREAGEPVAYIRGLKEFRGLAFAVDARALIPRPETEVLVEAAEREIVARLTIGPRPVDAEPIRVLDVGTGSGAIAVALAVTLRRRRMLDGEVEIVASDRSAGALALARENAVGHAVADAITFVEADLTPDVGRGLTSEPSEAQGASAASGTAGAQGPSGAQGRSEASDTAADTLRFGRRFDLVLANLPYIPSAEVDRLPIAASFEPRVALDGGPDGLSVIRRLVGRLAMLLAPDGVALLEIGGDQAEQVAALVDGIRDGGHAWDHEIIYDLGGSPRVVRIVRPGG